MFALLCQSFVGCIAVGALFSSSSSSSFSLNHEPSIHVVAFTVGSYAMFVRLSMSVPKHVFVEAEVGAEAVASPVSTALEASFSDLPAAADIVLLQPAPGHHMVVACGCCMRWLHAVVAYGGCMWWLHAVVACGGCMWWLHVVVAWETSYTHFPAWLTK